MRFTLEIIHLAELENFPVRTNKGPKRVSALLRAHRAS